MTLPLTSDLASRLVCSDDHKLVRCDATKIHYLQQPQEFYSYRASFYMAAVTLAAAAAAAAVVVSCRGGGWRW